MLISAAAEIEGETISLHRCLQPDLEVSFGGLEHVRGASRAVLELIQTGAGSALGLVASDERRDAVRSYLCPLEEAGELPGEGEADLRYAGQSFELTVPLADDLAAAFHRAHEERYGYADRGRSIELVAVRTAKIRKGPAFELPPGELLRVAGPALVELPGATCWVAPGWEGVRDGSSTLVLTRS